jgi:hypothetical protein
LDFTLFRPQHIYDKKDKDCQSSGLVFQHLKGTFMGAKKEVVKMAVHTKESRGGGHKHRVKVAKARVDLMLSELDMPDVSAYVDPRGFVVIQALTFDDLRVIGREHCPNYGLRKIIHELAEFGVEYEDDL